MLVPIVAMAIVMGVLPKLFLQPMEPSVERMVEQVAPRQPGGQTVRISRRDAELAS